MEILKILAPPLIGALIGYFTNYIAVKMLFHPYKEIKIGSFTLPFTPGVIPKRKDKIAENLGALAEDTLLTKQDIKQALLSEDVKKALYTSLKESFEEVSKENTEDILRKFTDHESYEKARENIITAISEKTLEQIEQKDLTDMAKEGIRNIIKENMGFLAAFVDENIINTIALKFNDILHAYARNQGREVIEDIADKSIEHIEEKPLSSLFENLPLDNMEKKLYAFFDKIVEEKADVILHRLNIKTIAQNKINSLEMPQLENLIISVMNKELSALINLGAVIGFVLGCVNIFLIR
ncbi:MAG: DUF445 family protein [Firmicutes bacterium]|nr:DUF445 family protein [Bacillota bacterium]